MAREAEERKRREEEAQFMAEQQRLRDEAQRAEQEKEAQERAKAEQEENDRLQKQASDFRFAGASSSNPPGVSRTTVAPVWESDRDIRQQSEALQLGPSHCHRHHLL